MTCPWLLPLALSLAIVSSSCSSGHVDARASTAGMSAGSDQFAVSGGGFRVETGQPVLFYGSFVENDRRTYTYLVITRNVNWKASQFAQSNRGTATQIGDLLSTDHTLYVQGTQLVASYSATIAEDRLQDRELKLGGSVVPDGDWLFLHDASDPGAGFAAVEVEMPELPAALEGIEGVDGLEDFTLKYVDELIANNETVRAFLAGDAK